MPPNVRPRTCSVLTRSGSSSTLAYSGPASTTQTVRPGSSLKRAASTPPALPAPTINVSKRSVIWFRRAYYPHMVSTSTLTQPENRTLTVNNLELHYHDWGSPEQPHLVLLHGLSGNAWAFAPFARRLRDRFHIVALDVRGHGDSAWAPDGAYAFSDQAADVAQFADQLGLDRFRLLGTSMGGMIALQYAGDHA